MKTPLRFGILGTGNIAGQFARDMPTAKRSIITAVGSRTPGAAQRFAQTWNIPKHHGSYDALLADPDVDAVYLTLPNTLHRAWTVKALEAGKHVLCEKPMAVTADDAAAMFDAAQRTGRVLIEAFMYRTHPLTEAVVQAVRSGVIGELRIIRASFCYRMQSIAGNTRFDPALGGGALLDIGCYCVGYAQLLTAAQPEAVHAVGHVHDAGVDDYAAGVLRFPGGVVATFTCGMTAQADNGLHLGGTDGFLDVPVPWKPPPRNAVYIVRGQRPPKIDSPGKNSPPAAPTDETHCVDSPGELYALEADAFADVVARQRDPFVTPEDTLHNLRALETMRRQLGLAY